MISSYPLRGRVLLGAIFTALCFLPFNFPNVTVQAQSHDFSVLCIAELITFPDESTEDPCDDTQLVTPNVTIIRSTTALPADLSQFEVIIISRSPNIFYNPIANRVNDYVANGGGLLLAFTNVELETNPLPSGFGFTVADDIWPEFPNDPGPIEFTAAGLAHPVNEGVSADTLVGTVRTIPISSLGSSWQLLAKAKNHPNAALAAGEHGTGRIILLELGVNDSTPEGRAYASQMVEWLAGESTPSPPAGPDMQIDRIEVTQAIQDLKNSVDLISGKRTFVRVHVSSPENIDGVSAELTATKNGQPLPQTLIPINTGGAISVISNPDRGQLNDSFLFELPIGWAEDGRISLKAEIDPTNAKLDPDRLNNTAGVQVDFISSEPVKLILINVGYNATDGYLIADEFHLDMIESWLKKAYPISSLDSERKATSTFLSGAPDIPIMIGRLALLRRIVETYEDIPADTVFYAVAEEDPKDLANVLGAARTIANSAVGLTGDPSLTKNFEWDTDGSFGDWLAGHEIAHLFGREHADCYRAMPSDSQPFPYEGGLISKEMTGDSAFYGFDIDNQAIYPPTWHDVMTYCENVWISDFTYEALYKKINGLDRLKDTQNSTVAADKFLIFSGFIDLDELTVDSFDVQQIDHSATRPLPQPGEWTVVLLDSAGTELASYPFSAEALEDDVEPDRNSAFFAERIPWADGSTTIEIRKGSAVLASKTASNNPPVVTITAPTTGTALDGETINFAWIGSDADDDPLTYTVLYSHTGEGPWDVLTTDLITPALSVDSTMLAGGTNSHLRIIGSDGFNSGEATVGPFTVPAAAPKPTISSPTADGEYFSAGQLISFAGSGYDLEDGQLTADSLSWSSNIDGFIGTGELAQTDSLSAGVHTITLAAIDSDSQIGQTSRAITVLGASTPPPNNLSVAPFSINLVMATAETVPARTTLTIRSQTNLPLAWTASTDAVWLSIDQTAGTSPSEITLTINSNGLAAGSYSGTVIFESAGAENERVEVPVFLEVSDTALPTFIWNVYLPTVPR